MQRVADLQAQGVARAETTRDDPAREHAVPQAAGVLGHAEQLAAVLARVAGPVDHHLDAVELGLREGERACGRQAEPADRVRPLHREQGVLVRDVADVGTGDLALPEPAEVGVAVRRVHDEQVAAEVEPVDD